MRRIYFEEDSKSIPENSPERPDAVAAICSFLVKWGIVAKGGRLPLHIFDGPSGAMVARMLLLCQKDIRDLRQAGAHRYASWHAWLVHQIDRRRYLQGWPKDKLEELRSAVTEFLPDPED